MKLIYVVGFLFSIAFTMYSQSSVIGKITAVKGKVFDVVFETTDYIPAKTDTCVLSKDLSGTNNMFGIKVTSGWMDVADVMLVSSNATKATFKVVKETSNITVNGVKKQHIVIGKRVKFIKK